MTGKIVNLERLSITLSPKVTKLLRAEMERQAREGKRQQRPEEIVEEAVTFVCEANATRMLETANGGFILRFRDGTLTEVPANP